MRDSSFAIVRLVNVAILAGCLILVPIVASSAQSAKTSAPVAAPGKATAAPTAPQTTPPVPPAIPAQPTAPAVNPVTQAAVRAGVLTCVSRINQVVTFLTANTKNSAILFTSHRQPDQSIFSVSFGVEGEKTTDKYASASFAPTTNGQASAVYDSVEYVAQPIADVETKTLKDLKRKGTLGKDIIMLDGGPVTVFLMPAGPGCIIIKKEVVQ
jgi:hypothetical protein